MDRLVIPVLSLASADVVADLAARGDLEVIAVAIDLGGGPPLDAVRDGALSAGARRCHVVDKRDALAEGALWPALRTGALDVPGAPIHTALSMPVVADVVADILRHENASAVAVWADDPLDRQRLRALLTATAPRAGLVAVAHDGIAPDARNLWAHSLAVAEGSTVAPARGPSRGRARLVIGFERGLPVHVSGVPMPPAELAGSVATIAADHGVGVQAVRDPESGRAWRIDAPGAAVLHAAMRIITARVVDARSADLLDGLASAYADLVRDGAWHSPARAGIDAAVDRMLAAATGDVQLTIEQGRIEGDA